MYITLKQCSWMRKSKNNPYEIPYIVKGNINLTGSQKLPKDICKDRKIGTRKVKEVEF